MERVPGSSPVWGQTIPAEKGGIPAGHLALLFPEVRTARILKLIEAWRTWAGK